MCLPSEIEVVSRDRGEDFAAAARASAPQAVQCADRFHLAKNLKEIVEEILARCRAEIRQASKPSDTPPKQQEEQQAEQTQDFMNILCHREGERLNAWLANVRNSQICELQRMGRSIEKDKTVVLAHLTLPHSNGVVEGSVNKLKCLKRLGFGRAGFALLRQRVLRAL